MLLPANKETYHTLKKYICYLLGFLLIAASIVSSFLMLESSVYTALEEHIQMPTVFIALNLATLSVLYALIFILCNRIWLSSFLMTLICGIIAIINHFVIMYHGMPLSFLLVKNFTTAMNVVSSYTFSIDYTVKLIALMMIPVLGASLLFAYFFRHKKSSVKVRLLIDLALCIACVLIMYVGYFSENPIKPNRTLGWIWSESYQKYGYAGCTVESIDRYFHAFNKPDGYSNEAVDNIEISAAENTQAQTPDIILLLNESMYDLSMISDIQTDIPYFGNMENMDNAFMGYAVVPSQAGGTNNSEYELLTSNSFYLLSGSAPFNTLDLTTASSIVSVLDTLGYETIGAHSEPAANYSRGRAYPALGFDHSYFEESFKGREYYQERMFETDESIYHNLYRWYEQMSTDSPRFIYTLTIQNHGQWNQNPPEADIVHAKNDYSENTETVNEFLSCMYLTDQAFVKLTEYFSNQDRPVIICMVGDHCPTIAEKIADPSYSEVEKALRLRTVPMIIWANYPLENMELGTMSINQVVPTLLEAAGVPLTPYYRYMLDMKKDVPIVTSFGRYVDSDGATHDYDFTDTSPTGTLVKNYFYLEYQNLTSDRNNKLQQPTN